MILHNIEMEQHILGSCLIDPNRIIPITIAEMKPNDFYDDRNRDIYETILSLFSQNMAIDILMVKANNPNVLVSYLSALSDAVASVHEIKDYIKEIKKLSMRREVFNLIGQLKQNLIEGNDTEEEIESFLNTISNIKNTDANGVVHIKSVLLEVYEKIKKGTDYGVRTGFHCLDEGTEKGLHKGRLYILATGTGNGKTAMVSNIVVNASQHGHSILILSVEMTTAEIVSRLIAIATETANYITDDYLKNTSMWDEDSKNTIRKKRIQGIGKLSDSNIYIDDRPNDILGITTAVKDLQFKLQRKGCTLDLIVVDYLQLIKANIKLSREQQVGEIADSLKLMAKSLNIPVIALAQTNRQAEKDDNRDYSVGDLRESARIEQNADMIMFLNRDTEDLSKFSLSIAKNRHGSTFKQSLHFQAAILKFTEVENEKKEVKNAFSKRERSTLYD